MPLNGADMGPQAPVPPFNITVSNDAVPPAPMGTNRHTVQGWFGLRAPGIIANRLGIGRVVSFGSIRPGPFGSTRVSVPLPGVADPEELTVGVYGGSVAACGSVSAVCPPLAFLTTSTAPARLTGLLLGSRFCNSM
ncbi:MAG: hypothetical protein CMJ90_08800 [Planctomycetes bacterium]|nr:hypothetical protein [Planctomycetota bacterium]